MFAARFADKDAGVDETRHGEQAAHVAAFGSGGEGLRSRRTDGGDLAVLNDDRAGLVHILRRIDDAEIGENGHGHVRGPWFCETRRASITAMRTATPISTC